MIDITKDAIQVLLDRPKGEGTIVSCHADTALSVGFQSLWSRRLKNEASAIEQRLADDRHARLRFARDSDVIDMRWRSRPYSVRAAWWCSAPPNGDSFGPSPWACR